MFDASWGDLIHERETQGFSNLIKDTSSIEQKCGKILYIVK